MTPSAVVMIGGVVVIGLAWLLARMTAGWLRASPPPESQPQEQWTPDQRSALVLRGFARGMMVIGALVFLVALLFQLLDS